MTRLTLVKGAVLTADEARLLAEWLVGEPFYNPKTKRIEYAAGHAPCLVWTDHRGVHFEQTEDIV